MYTKEHSPLGSQFSCLEPGSGSFTFFHSLQIKANVFYVGWPSFWKILTQSLICLAFFNELHPTKTLTRKEGFSEEAASAGIGNTGLQRWASLCSHPKSVFHWLCGLWQGFPGGSVVKKLPAGAGDAGDTGSIPESGRSPRGGDGNPLQCSCLGNSMDRGAWRATVHGVTESDMTGHTHMHVTVSKFL